MAAKNTDIIMTNSSVVHISTYNYDYIAGTGTIGYFLSTGNLSSPTCFDISAYDIKGDLTDSEEYLLSQWAYSAIYDSASYITAVEHLKNGVTWIWGSGEIGGLYVRKTSPTKCKIGGLTGMKKRSGGSEQQYVLQETPQLTISELTDLCLMYYEPTIGESNVGEMQIDLFTTADLRNNGQGDPDKYSYYSYANFELLPVIYSSMYNLTDMRNCTRAKDHYQILNIDYPAQFYTLAPWSESLSRPHDIPMRILGSPLTADEYYEWSDPWGGQAGDDEDDPNSEGGSAEPGGGNGDYPSETGNVDTNDASGMAINCVNSGFVTLYNPSLSAVRDFNNYLFVSITDVLSLQLKRLVSNPLDYVLFLALVHFTPPSTTSENIYFAGLDSGVAANVINNQFKKIDCGTVHIDGDTQTFLDYNNNTKMSIYLPYIGIQELDTDDIVGSDVSVVYNIDMLTGTCIAEIKCTRGIRNEKGDANLNDVIYNFSGNCFETFPLTAVDWRGIISGAVQLASGAASIVSGNASGIGAVANAIMSEKVSVTKSGKLSNSAGYMSTQFPYIIIERPINNLPYNYRAWKGYMLNVRVELGNISGYTEIEDDCFWVDSFSDITEGEASMLKEIMATGFYL
jgi:hypothetical protein